MEAGAVLAGRFEIERLAGSGGMGTVYRGIDRVTGAPVALKVVRVVTDDHVERFQREAKVLSDLDHPGFVQYVSHGVTGGGDPFLAMEWLDGESLGTRLGRGSLAVADAIALVSKLAASLAVAHERGIVHRDVKPDNVWLVEGDLGRPKVLDLGVARAVVAGAPTISHTGVMLGTPAYMAPEQARGERDVDGRADIFSLGCVLYECLAGTRAFTGNHVVAVLAKILFDPPPDIAAVRPETPERVRRILRQMLARERAERFTTIDAVASALATASSSGIRSSLPAPMTRTLTEREQRVLGVLVARAPGAAVERAERTLAVDVHARSRALVAVAAPYGGNVEVMADGSVVVTFSTGGEATDQAVRAARCALALRPLLAEMRIVLSMGSGVAEGSLPVGQVVVDALRLLESSDQVEICVDDVSLRLLDDRFHLQGRRLIEERETKAMDRLLLGRPTPFVGREGDLAILTAAFSRCVEDREAQIVLVMAPAGVGKSRLFHEFLRQHEADAFCWIGCGDPMREGAPLGLLAAAVRRSLSITGSEPLVARQAAIREQVSHFFADDDAQRISEFLGEIVGTPFPAEKSVHLRTARQDKTVMGDQMLCAWEDWLGALSAERPVVLVLEDLHWGDPSTVRFVDSALRQLSHRPILILASARPSVREKFPHLWSERGITEMRLRALSRKPCEQLVREVLGGAVTTDVVARVVDQAEGNAFYLEELIRTVSEGGQSLSASVLLMLQLRLAALPPSLRLVLRAGSVFGDVFMQDAIACLAGLADARLLDEQLRELTEREWLTRERGGRGTGATFRFRHDLVREASYTTLTEEDRIAAHALAADWLERSGETDAMVIAEHSERGGSYERAVVWYRRAAEQALETSDLEGAIARAEKGVGCGAKGEDLGALRVLQAEAHNWSAQFEDAGRCGREAMGLLESGTPLWAHAAHQVAWASGAEETRGATIKAIALKLLDHADPAGIPSRMYALACTNVASSIIRFGESSLSARLAAPIVAASRRSAEPSILGAVAEAHAFREVFSGNPASAVAFFRDALVQYGLAGDMRRVCISQIYAGQCLAMLGQWNGAEETLRVAAASAGRMGMRIFRSSALVVLGLVLSRLRRYDDAVVLLQEVKSGPLVPRHSVLLAEYFLAKVRHLEGDAAGAAHEAEDFLAVEPMPADDRADRLAMYARTRLDLGRIEEAVAAARMAKEVIDSVLFISWEDAFIRLVHAEALYAAGDVASAREHLGPARDRLLERAARMEPADLRESFLTNVPENARTLKLAEAWLGDVGAIRVRD